LLAILAKPFISLVENSLFIVFLLQTVKKTQTLADGAGVSEAKQTMLAIFVYFSDDSLVETMLKVRRVIF
jgi:hypothetical protein